MEHTLPSHTSSVCLLSSDLDAFRPAPRRMECALCLSCTDGEARLSTDAQQYALTTSGGLFLPPGCLLRLDESSPAFHARTLLLPADLYAEACAAVFPEQDGQPPAGPFRLPATDSRGRDTGRGLALWMDMADMLFAGKGDKACAAQERNYLQGFLLWLADIATSLNSPDTYGNRTQTLGQRFLQLVREHGAQEHHVAFYADALHITPRYLHRITVQHLDGLSPKEIIEKQLLAEVEARLAEPGGNIAQIARELHFPSQAYLSRFFKNATGMSPSEFRSSLKNRH